MSVALKVETFKKDSVLKIKENWDSRFGDRENQVVFIGKGYNKDDIIVELEKCLDERAFA